MSESLNRSITSTSRLANRRRVRVAVVGAGLAVLTMTATVTPALNAEATQASAVTASPTAGAPANEPAGAPAAVGTVMRTEVAQFNSGTNGLTLGFQPSADYDVSSGQPWGGISAGPASSNGVAVTVRAGRHTTKSVAGDFQNMLYQSLNKKNKTQSYEYGLQAGAHSPSELSFAFQGTLTVNGNQYPIAMGQGETLWYHNWWIGGATSNSGADGWKIDRGYLETPDGKYVICPSAGSYSNDYTFIVYTTADAPTKKGPILS